RCFHASERFARSPARAVNQTGAQSFRIVEQNLEQMLGSELLVALADCKRLGRLHKTAGAVGVFFKIHRSCSLSMFLRPSGARRTSSMGIPHRKSGLPDLRTILRNPGRPGLRWGLEGPPNRLPSAP